MESINYHILVADDLSEVVNSVTSYLEKLAQKFGDSLQIFSASSATDVAALLREHRIDVLFLDHHFPQGMSGDEIIDLIDDPFMQKLIILMSARPEEEIEDIIIKRHGNLGRQFKFLRKPFDSLEIQEKYLEIKQFFHNQPYPFPLAYAQNALMASMTAQGRIAALKDLVESLVKYCVAMLMSDLNRLGLINQLRIDVDWNQNFPLDTWLTWLKDILKSSEIKEELTFIPELVHLLGSTKTEDNTYLILLNNFGEDIRNTEHGQGYTKEEEWYISLESKYSVPISSLLRDIDFISRYILIIPEKVDFSGNDMEDFQYDVRVLMGTETRFAITKLKSRSRLRLNNVYVYSPKDEVISLYPFIIYTSCRECSLNRLYFLKNATGTEVSYNAFCNHPYVRQGKILFEPIDVPEKISLSTSAWKQLESNKPNIPGKPNRHFCPKCVQIPRRER